MASLSAAATSARPTTAAACRSFHRTAEGATTSAPAAQSRRSSRVTAALRNCLGATSAVPLPQAVAVDRSRRACRLAHRALRLRVASSAGAGGEEFATFIAEPNAECAAGWKLTDPLSSPLSKSGCLTPFLAPSVSKTRPRHVPEPRRRLGGAGEEMVRGPTQATNHRDGETAIQSPRGGPPSPAVCLSSSLQRPSYCRTLSVGTLCPA